VYDIPNVCAPGMRVSVSVAVSMSVSMSVSQVITEGKHSKRTHSMWYVARERILCLCHR
jgi:hypothetical protein